MNTKEQVESWDSILDEYEKTIGFEKYKSDLFPESELQQYLTMNRRSRKTNPRRLCTNCI
jgi:hypothetical protein